MSHILENDSEDNESSQESEYHSNSGSEWEEGKDTLSLLDQEYLLLDIWFPLPYTFPKLYLKLNEVISKLDDALLKSYVQEHHIAENPDRALSYILNRFSIDEVSQSLETANLISPRENLIIV